MNKGRSKMFAQKMKGVFRPRIFQPSNLKIKNNSNCKKDTGQCLSKSDANLNSYPNSVSPNRDISYTPHTIPRKASSVESERDLLSNQISGTPNNTFEKLKSEYNPNISTMESGANSGAAKEVKNDENSQTDSECCFGNEELFKPNAHASGIKNNRGFGGSFSESDLKKGKIINGCRQFCPLEVVDINRTSSDKIYGPETQSRRTRSKAFVSDGGNRSFWSGYKSTSNFDHEICYYCLKQNCVCTNSDVISTNNNYLFRTLSQKNETSPLFSNVLQYAFGEERTNRNDFIILALGIHHYIKEVFNALDTYNNGYVHYGDLQILCRILGKELPDLNQHHFLKSGCHKDLVNITKSCADNSCETHLHFVKFSEIICKTFSDQTDCNFFGKRNNTQLVNAMVNVTRRNKSLIKLSEQIEKLEKDYNALKSNSQHVPYSTTKTNELQTQTEIHSDREPNEPQLNGVYLENMKLQKIILLQQQELQCLREVIEDLRVSLQCSDAENLSLKVQEAKIKKFSFSSSSESSVPNLSSTDDERDSIDSMIHNFPSIERLINSKESFLSFESLNLSTIDLTSIATQATTAYQIEAKNIPKTSTTFLKQLTDEDLSLESEIQIAYQNLSETRSQLEETRNDLESTVSQIQDKDIQLAEVKARLTETKTKFESSLKENSILIEKLVSLKNDNDLMSLDMERLKQDLLEVRTELKEKDKEIAQYTNKLNGMAIKRKEDIRKLTAARNIIAAIIKEEKQQEKIIKSLRKEDTPKQSHSLPNAFKPYPAPKLDTLIQKDKNNNKTTQSKTPSCGVGCQTETTKSDQLDNTLRHRGCDYVIGVDNKGLEGVTAKHCEQYRLNLSPFDIRRNEFDCTASAFLGEEHNKDHHSSSSYCKNKNKIISRTDDLMKSPRLTLANEKSPMASSQNEEKPTMEVKPNLIKPIPVMKPSGKQQTHSFNAQKSTNQEQSHKMADELICKSSYKPAAKLFYELVDNIAYEPTTKENGETFDTSSVDLDDRLDQWMENCFGHLNDRSKDDLHPQKLKVFKYIQPARTSTQILEGLEAEVEFLRRSLDET